MNRILKSARLESQAAGKKELELINRQALRPLEPGEVFTFRLAACGTKADRDYERFTKDALKGLAEQFVGRPVLRDHQWSAGTQTARIYAAEVEETGEDARLILRAYMLRNDASEPVIDAIEAGILREASVGCRMKRAICGICGTDKARCQCAHVPGREYGGRTCVVDLDEPEDAYECSLVAVPAQPDAGIVKTYGGEERPGPEEALLMAEALQEQEEKRYGGNFT